MLEIVCTTFVPGDADDIVDVSSVVQRTALDGFVEMFVIQLRHIKVCEYGTKSRAHTHPVSLNVWFVLEQNEGSS